jgi:hypothetical protein
MPNVRQPNPARSIKVRELRPNWESEPLRASQQISRRWRREEKVPKFPVLIIKGLQMGTWKFLYNRRTKAPEDRRTP